MMEELISIIIPVYNAEKYLTKCVESVLQQTYKKIERSIITTYRKEIWRLFVKAVKDYKLINENEVVDKKIYKQFDLFSNNMEEDKKKEKELESEKEERIIQRTIINIKNKYGKNAIIKGMDLEDGATTIERNKEVGGHKG